MNRTEIKKAKKLLEPFSDLTDTVVLDTGGQAITAHWLEGGQTIFYALDRVKERLDDISPRMKYLCLSHRIARDELYGSICETPPNPHPRTTPAALCDSNKTAPDPIGIPTDIHHPCR